MKQKEMIFVLILIHSFLDFTLSEGIDSILRSATADQHDLEFHHEKNAVLFDSDMLFDDDDWKFIENNGIKGKLNKRDLDRMKRKGRMDRHWPKNTVHYEYDKKDKFSSFDRSIIQNAFDEYHKYTCLKFKPATAEIKRKIVFVNGTGCSSFVGTKAEVSQPVTLHANCRYKGVVLHELAHAIGCFHEQTRPDRDDYITVHHDNIVPGGEKNFQTFNELIIPDLGVPYDYQSLMHYGAKDMSKNGKPTITTKDPSYQDKLGNRKGFTYFDLKTINLMYKCGAHCPKPKKPCEGYMDKDCNCMCEGYNLYVPVRVCDGRKIVKPTKGKGGGKPKGPRRRCKDKVKDCRKHYQYCADPSWRDYMVENCARTCRCPKTKEELEKEKKEKEKSGKKE